MNEITSATHQLLGTSPCPCCNWSNFSSHWIDSYGNEVVVNERPAPEGCPACGYSEYEEKQDV